MKAGLVKLDQIFLKLSSLITSDISDGNLILCSENTNNDYEYLLLFHSGA